MDNCIFCQIVKGELPCYKIYEDENFLGFLDIRPLTKGNSLLIPKQHHRWVYDVANFGQYWEIAKKIGQKSMIALQSTSITFLTIGFEVPHAHIRIIPRYPDDQHTGGIFTDKFINQTPDDLQKTANLLKTILNQT